MGGIESASADDCRSGKEITLEEIEAKRQKIAKANGVTTIFTETLVSPAVSQAIAGDLGLKTDVLDPLEGVTENSPGTDYPSIMRANLEALRAANGCQ